MPAARYVVGIAARVLRGWRSHLHGTVSETEPANNPFLPPKRELRSSKLQESYWKGRQRHQMCSGALGMGFHGQLLQERVGKQTSLSRLVSYGSVWPRRDSSCSSSSSPLPSFVAEVWWWSG